MIKIRIFSFLAILSMLLLPVGANAAPESRAVGSPVQAVPVSAQNNLIAPPWCGTPEPDGVGSLPDGTQPTDPPGSFPHIPYYAIGCTLADIQARSNGRMEIRVLGQSAMGRDMYLVTINAPQQIAIPCLLCASFTDPTIGESRHYFRKKRAYVIGFVFSVFFFFVTWYRADWWILLPVPLVGATGGVIGDVKKLKLVDDDFMIQILPAVFLLLMWQGFLLLGIDILPPPMLYPL